MKLNDLSSVLEIDVQGSLTDRFMESEELYIRFLKKLLADANVAELKQHFADENWDEVLRKAHNLKGVCANLGLNKLSADFAAIVAELRGDHYTMHSVQELLDKALAEWEKTIKYIGQLE